MRNDYTTPAFKKWLDKLQQESWQLELIISGFAIFGLFTAFEPIRDGLNLAQNSDSKFLYIPWVIALISCLILCLNLILHVILRGLWIGALGLRYVSGDIDYETLNYSTKFTNYLKNKIGSFDKYISKLEDYCSILFAISFLMVFYVLSIFLIGFFISFVVYLIDLLSQHSPGLASVLENTFIISMLIGLFMIFIDFITQGALKRKKWLSKIYFPFYWFFGYVTLSFLYRPLVYNFLDNKFGKRLIFVLVPLYIGLFLATSLNYKSSNYLILNARSSENFVSTKNYDDLIDEKGYVDRVSLPSKIITTPYLNIFKTNNYDVDDIIFKFNESLKPEEDYRGINFDVSFTGKKYISPRRRDSISKIYLKTFNMVYKVYIDSVEYDKEFLVSRNTKKQLGFETVIGIDSLKKGKHNFILKRLLKTESDTLGHLITVPFWYYPE